MSDPYMGTEEQFFGVEYYSLDRGQYIDKWNPESYIRSTSPEDDGDPDDILGNDMHLPIFSSRLRQALKQEGIGENEIQYLAVHIFRSTGEELPGFAIANITARVAALDRENSFLLTVDKREIDPVTQLPRVSGIGRPALRAGPLAGHDIFRLTEFVLSVMVSHRFARLFKKHKFTGATFNEVDVSD